ncbi:TonB-dependent receptor [Fulvimonas sp. R45]|uniref:TonB-dependent receptor domain-containing protein n=1 Tax=Fulvimonas sp. R45 TaxID=3045937 RepID=UPI00265DE13F|nr:TonB-dependent receptor [Fulvimonas sp. R45]MDO1528916.1 TonB-dependent receptor [Fulvimonas sp. R45]
MLKSKLTVAVVAALAFGAVSVSYAAVQPSPSQAQGDSQSANTDTQTTDTDTKTGSATAGEKQAKRLDTVVVSGSLINNAQIQTATPTYTITADDIKARGFSSVQDVLQNSVMATGSVQGPQESGGFTQGAQTISLYGLNPEYTLTLIDGKPITQFGQLYNGQSNFTNISNIPLSMIDHIDIIPGGGSSIYGSQAIAGVVNIITKQHMDGAEVFVRTGNYKDGGGANQRIGLSFGHDFGKLNVLGSFEFDNQSPIWAYQRSLTRQNRSPEAVALIANYGTPDDYFNNGYLKEIGYVSPADGCAAMSGLFHGTTHETHSTVTTRTGTYCGSRDVLGYTTLQNQNRSYDGMLKLRYNVNENLRFYSDMLVDWQQEKWTPGSNFNWWGPGDLGGYIADAKTGDILYPERVFGPEEVGNDYYNQLGRQNDLLYQADIGANGTFGDSGWNWDVYYLRSGDRTNTSSPERMKEPVDAYFSNILGPIVGYDELGLAMYNPNYQAFYTPLTTAQLAGFMRNISGSSNTWVNNTRATVSNDSLFHLPGGDAGVAWLIEGGSQAWYEPLNPLILNNEVWGLTGTSGGGKRTHYASAFELNLPVLQQVTLDLSGRYDHYKTDAAANHKFTYKAGIEYRPFQSLLLRGNYATSFLAPDMSALFLGPSGNYQNITDYYLCTTQGGGKDCNANWNYEVSGETLANPKLKPTTAKSWTVGFVWAPIERMSLAVDYLHINIANEIAPQSADLLLKEEAQCRLGQLPADSPDCQAALNQVMRDPTTGQVASITQYNVNISNESTESVTAQASYQFNPTPVGTFGLKFDYNDMLKHDYQVYPGSPKIDQLTNPLYSSEFKSIASGALSWSLHGTWGSTLYWHRYGPTPNYTGLVNGANYPGAGRVSPWITWNWSLTYSPSLLKGLDLSVMVDNLTNKMPPRDPSYQASFPYYNTQNYNVYGREIMLQADWKFGNAGN